MKTNIAIATALVIGMIVQLATIVALAVYAPAWVSIPLIMLIILL